MAGIAGVITGVATIFRAAVGTAHTGWTDDEPDGFTALGHTTNDGVKISRDWGTEYHYAAARAEPYAEILKTALTTLEFTLVSTEEAIWETLLNVTATTEYVDLTATVGEVPAYAFGLNYKNHGLDKNRVLWLPNGSIKPVGETMHGPGEVATVPVMVSALFYTGSGIESALRLYSEA